MIKKIIIVTTILLTFLNVAAQDTILMPVTGHKDTTASHIVLYDDGGKESVHSAYVNSSVTVSTTQAGNFFRINVHKNLRDDQYIANLSIYNGDTNSENLLYSNLSSCLDDCLFYSDSDTITIKFKADDDYPLNGFEIGIKEYSCRSVTNLHCEFLNQNSAKLTWQDGNSPDFYIVEYIDTNYMNCYSYTEALFHDSTVAYGYQIKREIVTGREYIINNLGECRYLACHVYGAKVSGDDTVYCAGQRTFAENTLCIPVCNAVLPTVSISYNQTNDTVHLKIDNYQDAPYWFLRNNDSVMKFTADSCLIEVRCDEYLNVDIAGNIIDSADWCSYYSYGLMPQRCASLVYQYTGEIGIDSLSPHSAGIRWERYEWEDVNTVSQVVAWKKENEDDSLFRYDTVAPSERNYTIQGLEENTVYEIRLYTQCPYCRTYYSRFITTTVDNCIDFTNFYSPGVFLTIGNYDNPYENYPYAYRIDDTLSVWYNTDYDSRHTVMRDTNERDWNTNGQLRCIPEGESVSVRLGDSYIGREAESISYEYTVDSNNYDMLVLKYAIVMQDPGHTKANQPRFTLEILDSNNTIIDTACCFADFYAAGDLGWNEVEGTAVRTIWKDWTTIGIDIAPYHNQKIRVRLTTYDCDEGGHFGYAYFNIKCDYKKIYIVDKCNAGDSVYLEAIWGFDYYWHKAGESDTLSSAYNILVPVDNNVYECVASFVGKPSCSFTMRTVPTHIYPRARGEYSIDTCNSDVYFYNKSFVDYDTDLEVITNQFVDTVFWLFEDGTISYGDTIKRKYTHNGDYTVKLVSKLSNSFCTDTAYFNLHIDFNLPVSLTGKNTICFGQTDTLKAEINPSYDYDVTYLWSNGQTSDNIIVSPEQMTTYTVNITTPYGCITSLAKTVDVKPVYNDTVYASVCQGEYYNSFGFSENTSGVYTSSNQSVDGCDSLSVLNLTVNPVYDIHIYDTICSNEVYDTNGFSRNTTGDYVLHLQTASGCDSTVTLHLYVYPAYRMITEAEICNGEIYSQDGFSESRTGEYFQRYTTINGCDSVYILRLKVHETYDTVIYASICPDERYTEYNFDENLQGEYTQNFSTVYGCDSVVRLNLSVYPVYNDTIFVYTCDEDYEGYNFQVSESGVYSQQLQSINGCDSVSNLSFYRHKLFIDTVDKEIYSGQSYDEYGFNETSTGEYSLVYTDMYGCDSTYILDLKVIKFRFPNTVTANGDGVNDIFEITDLAEQTMFDQTRLIIYSRYGKVVYDKENIRKKEDFWDPVATNTPSGTYFYRFIAKSETKNIEFNGTVEVLR